MKFVVAGTTVLSDKIVFLTSIYVTYEMTIVLIVVSTLEIGSTEHVILSANEGPIGVNKLLTHWQ